MPERGGGMLEIPYDALKEETLNALIEDFVTRDGTDYGATEISLETKVAQVRRQLACGEAVITYDEESDSCALRARAELRP